MNRRQYLALAGGALAGLAGCTDGAPSGDGSDGEGPGDTNSPTGTPVTGAIAVNRTPDLDRLDAPFAQRAVGSYYLAVVSAADEGERLATELGGGDGTDRNGEGAAFVRETDYSQASVVCLQDARSSSHPDLELTDATVADGVATLEAQYPGREATSDITTDLLAVRIAETDLEHATVALTSTTGEATRFSTVGRYGRTQLDEPRPLVVRNRDCEAHHADVSATVDGELVADTTRTDEYPAGSVVRRGGFLTEAATHTVRASTAARETIVDGTVSTTAGADEPVGVLVDVSGEGSVSVEGRPVADLPASIDGDCEASSLPYESSDPSKNVAEPARLEWVNRSDADRTVRLVVREEDHEVVDRDVAMPAGGKGRTEALIAKRGVYDTSLTPDEGTGRRVDWQMDESGDDLQVMVEADGSLTVATSSLA
jgi:hypothetical protein